MALILVVDDDPDIRGLVRMIVGLDGHTVVAAANGAEALVAAEADRPDLIILDVMMPKKDGLEVLAELKTQMGPEVAAIPVILLTAKAGEVDRLEGEIEGALHYVTKPFSPDVLLAHVAAALSGEPELVKRRRVQARALEALARIESGSPAPVGGAPPRPHITRLGRAPEPPRRPPPAVAPEVVATLSVRQMEILRAVGTAPTVSEAADRLAVSRANVYSGLRRIARKLDVHSVPELVSLVRTGDIPVS